MEAAMNDIPTLRLVEMSQRHYSLATFRGIIAAWRERAHFRWELEQMLRDNPHLIDDVGLTKRQAEAEIAMPFWQTYGEHGNDMASSVPARLSGSPALAIAGMFAALILGPRASHARHRRERT
jgi:uncharacterized protein YjiS (DUF1127 family)